MGAFSMLADCHLCESEQVRCGVCIRWEDTETKGQISGLMLCEKSTSQAEDNSCHVLITHTQSAENVKKD